MAKFDLGKSLKKAQNAIDSVAVKAKDTKLSDIKIPEIKKEDLKDAANTVKEAAGNVREILTKKDKDSQIEDHSLNVISTKSAIQIIYYLMAVDGDIKDEEENNFDEIACALDPNFAEHKNTLVTECKSELGKVIDDGDYYDVIQDATEKALWESRPTKDAFITPKMLIWDLLTIAYSDDIYHESERKLLKYLVRKLNVDKAVFGELESSLVTITDIDKELQWIKTTERPYLTIEAIVNELEERKAVIFESVKALIML